MPLPLLGLAGAVGIGLSLGLLGSGGSIVTVPVLVYLFGQPEKLAVAGSLGVVGVVAAFGALLHARAGTIAPRVAAIFAPASMLGAWAGATASQYVSGALQLRVFAVAMLIAAVLMLLRRSVAPVRPGGAPKPRVERLLLAGVAVGTLTGFVGVGGGFLIVPALVIGGGLGMHLAVGTSLVIIALTALIGFTKHLMILTSTGLALDYQVLALVAFLGIGGGLLGQRFGSRIPAAPLRRLFGAMVILLGAYMLLSTPSPA